MREFNPEPNTRVTIGGYEYTVKPHPSVPAFAFGQEGRKAFVYQVSGGVMPHELWALKKFKPVYRVPEMVEVCDSLARFAQWRGLEVCARQVLRQGPYNDVLSVYPDLEYAVLMPWVTGSTWYDIIVSETPLSRFEALTFANATSQVLASLEEAGLAHCDIAAPNIIINVNTGRAHLIDVEDLYAPGFASPSALPAGTEGYAHQTASTGLWKPTGDRFAGAVIMAEMAAWHDPRIRKKSEEEHYFGGHEMQQDGARYQLMYEVLASLHADLADLFEQAWFSETLEDCPPLSAWAVVINEVHHRESLAKVVNSWQPIVVPGIEMPQPEPRTAAPAIARQAEVRDEPRQIPAEPEEEISAPPAPQPAVQKSAAQVSAPAPVNIPQATPPPQPVSKPPAINVATSGGPVVEWVPLTVPTTPAPSQGNGSPQVNRPIITPAPLETSTEAPLENPVNLRQAEQIAEPTQLAEPSLVLPDPHAALTQMQPVPDLPDLEDYQEAQADDAAEVVHGTKPVLDVSHIDRRNRPFLVWTENSHATGYQLHEADNPDFNGAKEFKIKAQDTKWHPHWGRSGRLFYRVRAVIGDRVGPWSDTLSLRIGSK